MSTAEARLDVEGEVAATAGDLVARLTAAGNDIDCWVSDFRAFHLASPALGRRGLIRLADELDRLDLTVTIRDSKGMLLAMGSIRPSTLGRIVLGTAQARISRPFSWILARR